jgi:hypothetical protein
MGGTVVTLCVSLFYVTCCKWTLGKACPNERTRDEWAHVMRWDAYTHLRGLVYNDWVKRSPHNTSLCGVVNGPSCPADSMFQ